MIHRNIGQDHGKVITHAQSIALAPRCGSPLNEGGGKQKTKKKVNKLLIPTQSNI